jgi:hypothetical protein
MGDCRLDFNKIPPCITSSCAPTLVTACVGNMASGLPTSRSSSHSSYVHPRSAIKRISTRGSTRAGPAGGTGGRRESTGAHGLKAPPSSDPHQHQNSSKGRKPSYTGSSPFTSSFKKSSLARVSDKGTGDVWQQGLTGAQSFARVSISGVSTGGRRESQGWGPSQSGRRSSLRFNAPSPQGEGVASRIASMARTMSASTGGLLGYLAAGGPELHVIACLGSLVAFSQTH